MIQLSSMSAHADANELIAWMRQMPAPPKETFITHGEPIVLALSVLGHFIRAMTWLMRGQMTSRRFRFIHLSVFAHMISIVLLAKGMFHVSW